MTHTHTHTHIYIIYIYIYLQLSLHAIVSEVSYRELNSQKLERSVTTLLKNNSLLSFLNFKKSQIPTTLVKSGRRCEACIRCILELNEFEAMFGRRLNAFCSFNGQTNLCNIINNIYLNIFYIFFYICFSLGHVIINYGKRKQTFKFKFYFP